MRRFVCLLLAVAIAQPALAAESVTVDELEHLLVKLKSKPDWAAADRLSGLELTERATSARLARWETELRGKRSREALIGLVDASAFLRLPASDVSSAPPPDRAAQMQLFLRAVAEVVTVINRLPNLYATRETTHFEDTLAQSGTQVQESMGSGGRRMGTLSPMDSSTSYEPIHSTDKFSSIVSIRDGGEVTETQEGKKTANRATGLTTSGEFGPILSVVFGDAQHGSFIWDHWEQGTAGPLAVFKFIVPEEESHFMVTIPNGSKFETSHPAYHGEIAIDPTSGEIYRVTEVADYKPPQDKVQAEILVEYGSVQIGEQNYICPVRGVAILKLPVADDNSQYANNPALQTYVNDVVFSQYHLFRAETRILPE